MIHVTTVDESTLLEPSPLVRRFASKIARAAADIPIVDVACGSGRNALLLAELGCTVICVDKDLTHIEAQRLRLSRTSFQGGLGARLTLQRLDLVKNPWPFGPGTVGAIINVHFFLPALLASFESSLSPGGYLLFETIPGCGGNYLKLPMVGEVRSALKEAFEFELYKEGRVGPAGYGAVTVKMLARKKVLKTVT